MQDQEMQTRGFDLKTLSHEDLLCHPLRDVLLKIIRTRVVYNKTTAKYISP